MFVRVTTVTLRASEARHRHTCQQISQVSRALPAIVRRYVHFTPRSCPLTWQAHRSHQGQAARRVGIFDSLSRIEVLVIQLNELENGTRAAPSGGDVGLKLAVTHQRSNRQQVLAFARDGTGERV